MGPAPVSAQQADSLDHEPITRPPRLPYLDTPARLGLERGAWTYDFGTPGWPDAWSPYGLDPMQVGLQLGSISFNDPVTGRPLYELLPYDKLLSLDREGLVIGRPEGMRGALAPYQELQPITEMVYRSTNTGLQQVSVVHAQTRRAGTAGRIQYLFGYAGAGARGEYEGSKLSRKRQTLFRVKRESDRFRLELGQMFNRHRVGAHGGVVPFESFGYRSIYERLGASTRNSNDQRQLSRNDLWAEAALPRLGLTLRPYWTVSTLTFRDRANADTAAVRVSRFGAEISQSLFGRFAIGAAGHLDTYPNREGWLRQPDSRLEVMSSLSGRHRIGAGRLSWSAGLLTFDTGWRDGNLEEGVRAEPVFAADLQWQSGVVRPFIHSRNGVSLHSAMDVHGFGGTVTPFEASVSGRQAVDEIGVSLRPGWLHLMASVAATRNTDGLLRMGDAQADTITVFNYSGLYTRTSATARLGLREFTRRGFYLWAEATGSTFSGVAPTVDPLLEEAVPKYFAKAALGFKGLFFQGDLDGDFFIQGRGWTEHTGMRLHPDTGLLVLPQADSRAIEQSMVLDFVIIAHIREATITVSLENFMSGTVITPGNQFVPDYPYPEQRLRFSVFWPILN